MYDHVLGRLGVEVYSISETMSLEIIMSRYSKKIDKISKKMAIKLKKLEVERVKKARAKEDA